MTTFQIQSKLANGIREIEMAYDQHWSQDDLIQMNQQSFIFVLGALSATRRIPGIDQHMGFENHYYCSSEQAIADVKKYLATQFGIHDQESLLLMANNIFTSGRDYEIYRSFFNNVPSFNPNALDEKEQASFYKNKEFAENFEPFLTTLNCFAYDFNERITLLRAALACGLLNEAEFSTYTKEMAEKSLKYYKGWKSYAISCACGGALFMYKLSGSEQDALNYFDYLVDIIKHLIIEDRVWLNATWGYPHEVTKR